MKRIVTILKTTLLMCCLWLPASSMLGQNGVDIGVPSRLNPSRELPDQCWTDLVTEQPEGYVVDANGDVHLHSAEALAWLSVVSNGLNGQEADDFDGKTVYLEENVDLTGYAWIPIATHIWTNACEDNRFFKGVFDGKQHRIDNIILSKGFDISYVGLFGNVVNGEIRNVVLAHCWLDFYYETTGFHKCGLLAYMLKDGAVARNCYVHCLDFKTNSGGMFVKIFPNSSVINCMVRYDFKYEANNGCGICDINQGAIINCASVVDTLRWPYSSEPSGIASVNDGTIRNCYSFWGDLEDFPFYAPIAPRNGVAAYNDGGNIENCFYNRMPQEWQFDEAPGYDGTFQNVSAYESEHGEWQLMNPIFMGNISTNNLVEALNLWIDSLPNSEDYLRWRADTTGFNHGLPIFADYDLTNTAEDQLDDMTVTIYPNPATDFVNIAGDDISSASLYDIRGIAIPAKKWKGQTCIKIDMKGLDTGIYLIKVETINGICIMKRIVKS